MRISISGSHSTGKTTLAEACYLDLLQFCPNDVTLIREVARGVIARGFPLNQEATVDSYLNYIHDQLFAERQAIHKHVISDRSLVDLLAYIRVNSDPKIPNYFINMVEELTWLESRYFDSYCYIPVEFDLIADSVRPAEKEYHLAIDRMVATILLEYKIDYSTIKGDLDERRKMLLDLFKKALD